jgi:hypothetical protein
VKPEIHRAKQALQSNQIAMEVIANALSCQQTAAIQCLAVGNLIQIISAKVICSKKIKMTQTFQQCQECRLRNSFHNKDNFLTTRFRRTNIGFTKKSENTKDSVCFNCEFDSK